MTQNNAQPLYDTFARIGLRFTRGNGAWLISDNGERYLDFTSGIAVNALGHNHPKLVKAIEEQANKLWHVSNLFESPEQEKVAERLCANSFADKVFFCNSGAEAIECAIKTARRYQYVSGHPERYEIITFEGAFHGRTLATLAAGGQEKYLEGFGPKAQGFIQVPFDDEKALRAAIGEKTAALLIEPIQGESGLRPVPKEFMQLLRRICDENGLLFIVDEVQTGMGRTGKLFAYQWSGIEPDIMALAKGLGGGFPIGACLATKEAAKGMTPGTHGSTFGGNLLAMAAANAVLDVMLADGFLDHVNAMANLFKQGLASIIDRFPDVVESIRGVGLLTGLKCVVKNTEVIAAMRDEKLLGVGAGNNVIRLLPPLTVTEDEIRDGLHRIEKAIQLVSNAHKQK
ncbi:MULTISPECIES: aspartate aminotransferase family protein [Bartonella]|uniref:aspartate aminotransferase family protein n=1 Tax=Bartonella TaxID=773 RepID=UPI0018DECD1B|nr:MULTISPECIES: aspartate aminotransferase family protein [Bartonella]MBH9995261.1 aspartate aminotransferase family protein [Bartonella sp. P0291]MBH9996395.1 aspartate aminotransferase family protein [Bartonella sp. M0192]MBH9998556.1 aspartate aminotransferase family protein [Bartonella sp. M0191]MBI0007879.1 aspartate aminotransferase family protein [Bartonella sp. M0193]MBI0009846.1 aspartate aminotransferase family protein [Bartonella sp. M0176]